MDSSPKRSVGSTITMRFLLGLLAGGMLPGVSGQADPFSAYGNIHHQRLAFPSFFATAAMMPVFIGTGIHSTTRAIANTFAPTEKSTLLTTGTSNTDDDENLYNGLAVALFRPLEAPGADVPTTAAEVVPADKHACGLATANITDGTPDTPAMIAGDASVDTSSDNRHSTTALVLYRPVEASRTVEYFTCSAFVPAGKLARAFATVIITGGNVGAPAMVIAGTPVASSNTDDDPSNAFAVVLHRPSNSMANTESAAAALVRTTLVHSSTTTDVTGGDGDARAMVTVGITAKDTQPHHASTSRPSPSDVKARLQARQGDSSDRVVEVPAEFDDGVGSVTPVAEVPTVSDGGEDEAERPVPPNVKGSSSKVCPKLSKLALAASVLPLDIYELYVAFPTLGTAVSTFLSESWSDLWSGLGLLHLTPADVWAQLRDMASWCLMLLASADSAIEEALVSFNSWIWSFTLGQDVLFTMAEVSLTGWGCFGRSAFEASVGYLVARKDWVMAAMGLFLLLFGPGYIVIGITKIMDHFIDESDEDTTKPAARECRVHSRPVSRPDSRPRKTRRGRRGGAKKKSKWK